MRRLSLLMGALLLAFPGQGRGQDAATEERLNKLSGQIEDLMAAQRVLSTRIEELAKEIADLRDGLGIPNPIYATQDDFKRLTDSVEEIEQKRRQDYEKIRSELMDLGQSLTNSLIPPEPLATNAVSANTNTVPAGTNGTANPAPETGPWEYTVQPNDSLSVIAQTFRREKNLKVTVADILKANPGLVPARIRPGQRIVIPAPP